MKKAEEGGRKWSAIGVDDWIEAGKWWLMKVGSTLLLMDQDICDDLRGQLTCLLEQSQLQLSDKSLSVTGQGYLDLVKASWILIDVIKRHPQLNLLNTSIRYEVELLAEVSRHSNDRLNGV